jgi:hypothetical protein
MSDPRAKTERSKAKDIRQGIVEQKPVSSNSKKKPKYAVYADLVFMHSTLNRKNYCVGKYATMKAAKQAHQHALKVKYYSNVRIQEL